MYDQPLLDILERTRSEIGTALGQVGLAEDVIKWAQKQYPGSADLIWHSFGLLGPTHERMETEFVYRSHCRELLLRVRHDTDTRPGTFAEVACACSAASELAPMTEAGYGTFARAWNEARFPTAFPDMNDTLKHVEALHGSQIDDMVTRLRGKLAVPGRKFGAVECVGYHHGQPAPGCAVFRRSRDAKVA